jgi:ribulose-5-phosphate 4-epimerase/fuculose-1-phosphate aldolase
VSVSEHYEERIGEFVEACRRVAAEGLVRVSSGNLSWRLGDGRVLLTGGGTWLGEITEPEVAVCRLEDGAVLNRVRPSAELGFHLGILRARPDVNVVLHFQTPCATAIGCMDGQPPSFYVIPEIPYYIGPVAFVPYLNPGTAELAQAVVEAMRSHNMAILRNHGEVTVAADFRRAIQNAAFFELACDIVLKAGNRLIPMRREDSAYLVDKNVV